MRMFPAILFLLFILVACVCAFVVKSNNVKAERAWKDVMLASQVEFINANAIEHEELRSQVVSVKNLPRGLGEADVRRIIAEVVKPALAEKADPAYSPTAYCATVQDGEHLRLDCVKYPVAQG